MQNNRTLLIAATACGMLSMVIAFVYLSRNPTEPTDSPAVEILVATRDLAPNASLDAKADVEPLAVPQREDRQGFRQRAIGPEHREAISGRRINRLIPAGTPLLWSDLTSVADLRLSADKRAMALNVDGANAVGGLLVPGDLVKLVVTRPVPKDRTKTEAGPAEGAPSMEQALAAAVAASMSNATTGEVISELVSDEAFRVLAVGRNLSGSRQQFGLMDSGDTQRSQTSGAITVEVTEDQAKQILQKTSAGKLTLLLCPPPANDPMSADAPPSATERGK